MLSARASTPAKAVEDSSPDVGAALPVGGAVATALFLQRSAGNAAVARLLGRKLLRQGNPDAGPPPSDAGAPGGTEKVTLGKFDIWLEPATQRRHVEGMVADKGFAEPRRFLDEALLELDRQTPDAGVPDNQADLEKARPALASYKQVIATFESDVEAFLTDFETKGRKVAGGLLDDSEARAKAEGIKYGITAEQIQKTINRGTHEPIEVTETHYHMDKESPEAATVAAAAKKLLERRAEIAPIKKKRADAQLSYARGFGPAGGGPVPPPPPELATLDAQIAEKELAYDMLANELSARHPSLANAAREKDDTSALQTLAAGPSDASAQIIGSQIADTLTKIAKVRKELEPGGGVNIYKLPKIVALTKAQAAATDWKGKAVDEKIQKAQADEATIAIALGVLNLALLALAPATGGASLVVAAGISSVAAVEHAQEYMLEAAMSGSDVDKARALSQDDPSLFWLAADIVFAMVDIGQAASAAAKLLGTFRRLAPIAREIKVAESAEDAKKAVEALEKAAAEAGGEKLAQKVAESAKGEGAVGKVLEDVEAVEGTARAAETELKAAGEASAEGGRHVHVTNRGKLFSCSSPCTEIRAKYGETLARKPDLMGQVEKLENEAKALGEKATKQQLDAVAAKVLQLDDVIGGAARLERAEKIVAWLKTVEEQFPIVKGLDAEQLARVIEKTNVSHIKGQLLEELMANRVKGMLAADSAEAAKLFGRPAKGLEFIPGHRIKGAGRQFTDGMVVIKHSETDFEVVAILESKAGKASSRGLSAEYTSLKDLTEEEAKAVRLEGIDAVRDANPALESMPSWKIDELYKADVDKAVKALPKTEPGQAVLDLERLVNGGVTVDGQAVKVRGGRGSTKVVGAVPKDVSPETLKNAVSPGKADVKFDALPMEIEQKQLQTLAEQIADRAKAPSL